MKPVLDEISDEEDAAITKAALEDPDTWIWSKEDFARARPVSDFPDLVDLIRRSGRPVLPPEDRKRRVTMYLDPDVLSALKAGGKGWQTRANAALRAALGLAGK